MKNHHALRLQLGLALALIFVLALAPTLTMAADPPRIVGTWEGVLDPGAQPKKHVVVHISADQDGTLGGTIDYPDQEVSGIQITAITYKAHILHFESTPNLSSFDGTLNKEDTEIAGTWKQGGAPLTLTLKRTS
jgi:D-alanyl-D-alanine-carboxypeptidase/D-alanyl-D-alanine-endopeptidase